VSLQFSPFEEALPRLRANGAEHTSPGQRPGEAVEYMFRPVRAEDFCALAGRTDQFQNPGRCPGLECGGAFSAGIKIGPTPIHENLSSATYEIAKYR